MAATSAAVFQQIEDLAHETNVAALVATHNLDLAASMDRVLALEAGRLVARV